MDVVEKVWERILIVEFVVAIRPMKEEHFIFQIWAYRHHFCIVGRDLDKRITMDYGIAYVYGDLKEIGKKFVGYVEHIIKVSFSPTINFVVIKQKWSNPIER
jgi:hypothetical protein